MSKRSNRGKYSGEGSEPEVALGQDKASVVLSDTCKLCNSSDNSRMVCCDTCGDWFHFDCVSVDESVADVDWNCKICEAKQAARGTASFSTLEAPAETNPTSLGTIPKQAGEYQEMWKRMENLQELMGEQKESYERLMKVRELDQQRALKEQQAHFEKQLKTMEQQFASRLQVPNINISPNANSTSIDGTDCVAGNRRYTTGGASASIELQLSLLAEKQALEMKHLEERLRVLQTTSGAVSEPVGARSYTSRLDANAQAFRSKIDPLLSSYSSHDLSRSQLAARQAVAKELPIFTGASEEWPLFIATYENTTRMCGFNDEENLLRLQRSLKGKALEAVRSRLLYPAGLPGVIQTLRTLFGRPEVIIHSLVCRIRSMPSPKMEKLATLIDFGVAVQNMFATIKACGLEEQLCNVALLQELVDRLPSTIKLNWAMHRQTLHSVTLSDFGIWLKKLVEAACAVTIPSSMPISTMKTEKRSRKEDVNVHLESEIDSSSKPVQKLINKGCFICHGSCSSASACKKFQNLDVSARWAVLKQHKLCRKCLTKHFGACEVKNPCGRNGCTYMHHELLHDDSRYQEGVSTTMTNTSEGESSQNCNTHVSQTGKILFRYVPVTIHGRGVSVETYAFLDDGSSATLMEHSLLKELKLEGKSETS